MIIIIFVIFSILFSILSLILGVHFARRNVNGENNAITKADKKNKEFKLFHEKINQQYKDIINENPH